VTVPPIRPSSLASARAALLALALLPAAAAAQQEAPAPGRLQLHALAGYQLSSDVSTSAGTLRIDDGPAYGAALGYLVRPGAHVELLYVFSPTEVSLAYAATGAPPTSRVGLDVHYLQIGGTQAFRGGTVEPYLGGSLGAVVLAADSLQLGSQTLSSSTVWQLGATIGGGAKVWAGRKVAVRLEARLLLPIYVTSATFWAGGGGSGLAVSGGVPFVQGWFAAGLTFAP
jgi:hypothetical protein